MYQSVIPVLTKQSPHFTDWHLCYDYVPLFAFKRLNIVPPFLYILKTVPQKTLNCLEAPTNLYDELWNCTAKVLRQF